MNSQFACLNCGHSVGEGDRFCSACGQEKKELDVSLLSLLSEFFSSALSVRGKLLSTGSMLLFRPGQLTREFVEGRRVGVISPIKLFLWCSVIYFLIAGLAVQLHPMELPIGKLDDGDTEYNLRLGSTEVRMKESEWNRLSKAKEPEFEAFLKERNIPPNSWTAFMLRRVVRLMGEGGVDKFRQARNQVSSHMTVVAMPLFGVLAYMGFYSRVRNMVHAMVYSAHVHAFAFLVLAAATIMAEWWNRQVFMALALVPIIPYCVIAARRAFPNPSEEPAPWFSKAMLYLTLASFTQLFIYLIVLIGLGLLVVLGSLVML